MSFDLNISMLQPASVTENLALKMLDDLRAYWDEGGGLNSAKVTSVDCAVCGTPCPSRILFEVGRFPYRRCPECSVVYPSPRPRSEEVDRQYVSGRFSSAFRDLYLPSAAYRMATIYTERVEQILMPRVPSGRLLDVGCSSGHFLKVALDHGYDIHGVEPNPEMAKFATESLKLPKIQCGTLHAAHYPDASFDAVTLWDVLEHVEDPGGILEEVRRVLRPGGWVFAYTENFESFNVFVTGKYSEMVAPDVHLRHYTPEAFRRQFERAGFEVDTVCTKGLDVAHIQKTFRIYPDHFRSAPPAFTAEGERTLQQFINQVGKGDNLRLFALKREPR